MWPSTAAKLLYRQLVWLAAHENDSHAQCCRYATFKRLFCRRNASSNVVLWRKHTPNKYVVDVGLPDFWAELYAGRVECCPWSVNHDSEGVIFYRWCFFFLSSFSLFWRLMSEVTERISTKLGHIFTYDSYLTFFRTLPGIYHPHGRGQKTFFETDFELWPNISLQWNTISTIGKKLGNLQEQSTCPTNLVNFDPKITENGWRVFAYPLNFRIGRHCQPYRMDVI